MARSGYRIRMIQVLQQEGQNSRVQAGVKVFKGSTKGQEGCSMDRGFKNTDEKGVQ